MSHPDGEEAVLTEAAGATKTQRRPQNKRRTTASGSGAPWARAQSEREGEGAQLSAQLSGEGRVSVGRVQKRLGRMPVWPENERSWARPQRRARVVRGGTVLTSEAHRSERVGERMGFCTDERGSQISKRGHARVEEFGADKSVPLGSEREERRRGLAPIGGDHLSEEGGRVGGGLRWAELGWLGRNGGFLFPGISDCFSIYFSLGFSNQIQIKCKFKPFQTCASNKRIN